MSETIIAVIITGLVSIITTLMANNATRQKMATDLDKRLEVMNTELKNIKDDVKEHNHYAKLFAESMPVVQEQIKNIYHQLDAVEKKVG